MSEENIPKRPYNKLKSKVIAKTMLQVFKETGKINMTETSRRLKPNIKEASHNETGHEMLTDEVYEQFIKLMSVDDTAASKLKSGDVVKDILNDIHVANIVINSPDATMEEVQKFMAIKTAKQKLLADILGALNGKEKPIEETDPDSIFRNSFGSDK